MPAKHPWPRSLRPRTPRTRTRTSRPRPPSPRLRPQSPRPLLRRCLCRLPPSSTMTASTMAAPTTMAARMMLRQPAVMQRRTQPLRPTCPRRQPVPRQPSTATLRRLPPLPPMLLSRTRLLRMRPPPMRLRWMARPPPRRSRAARACALTLTHPALHIDPHLLLLTASLIAHAPPDPFPRSHTLHAPAYKRFCAGSAGADARAGAPHMRHAAPAPTRGDVVVCYCQWLQAVQMGGRGTVC